MCGRRVRHSLLSKKKSSLIIKVHPGKVTRLRKSPIPRSSPSFQKVPWPLSPKLVSVQIIAVGSKFPIGIEALAANQQEKTPPGKRCSGL